MKASLQELLSRIPGAPSLQWPEGERYALAFSHGTMSLGFYAPRGRDPQTPHKRDEIYIVHSGSGTLTIADERHACAAGDAFFVASGVEHRFEDFSDDFSAWVVFWGPAGGETR
ncbi:cupin domain-containing protein [Solimonas marina]|uniref:Cupin domain-containing protein n=1 Tax=Solimonas marina TaxID=2714601 RepID=A0A969WDK7_9GAMM|nr:cupin domain-containing protein [Solimonas marina]NKF24115.1 cupin domain-containing protein [Solimonas marina]